MCEGNCRSKTEKKCSIIDISVGLDVNVTKIFKQKRDNYLPLAAELKRLYKTYTFEIIPIAIGATGLVTNSLKLMLKRIGDDNVSDVVLKCQKSAIVGTLKIVKSFMKMWLTFQYSVVKLAKCSYLRTLKFLKIPQATVGRCYLWYCQEIINIESLFSIEILVWHWNSQSRHNTC